MSQQHDSLTGKSFLIYEDDGVQQGRIVQRLSDATYYVEVFFSVDGRLKTVGRVLSVFEMGGFYLFDDASLAFEHAGIVRLAEQDEIDLRRFAVKDQGEMIDLCLDELGREGSKKRPERADEVINLLKQIAEG